MATRLVRHKRVTSKLRRSAGSAPLRPRLSVYKSSKHVYVQLIDDNLQKTIAAFHSRSVKDEKSTRSETAYLVGKKVAELAIAKGISEASFDRGGFIYHGVVEAVATGARSAGLII